MTKTIKEDWDLISDKKRKSMIADIIEYFREEEWEDIWVIKAEDTLNFYLKSMAIDIYNKGVKDTKNVVSDRFLDLDVDIDSLLKE